MKGIHQAISAGAKFESQILSSMERTISIDGQDEINLIDFIHDNTDPGVMPLSYEMIARLCTMEIGEQTLCLLWGKLSTIKRIR